MKNRMACGAAFSTRSRYGTFRPPAEYAALITVTAPKQRTTLQLNISDAAVKPSAMSPSPKASAAVRRNRAGRDRTQTLPRVTSIGLPIGQVVQRVDAAIQQHVEADVERRETDEQRRRHPRREDERAEHHVQERDVVSKFHERNERPQRLHLPRNVRTATLSAHGVDARR